MQSASSQGTEAWHEARALKVTGSRIGAILGHSPWMTREDVMREFIRAHQGLPREEKSSPALSWGLDHEDAAIAAYEAATGNLVDRSEFVDHPDIEHIGCSPDGIVDDGLHVEHRLLEVKCPYNQKIPDKVPDHYIDQVQLSMEVLECSICDFVYWTPNETKMFHVERDEEWFKATLPIIYEFLEEFESRKDEELIDFVECDDDDAIDLSLQLIAVRQQIKELQAQDKKIVADIAQYVDPEHDTVIGKLYANHVTRKGGINWKAVYADHPEIEKTAQEYRREDTSYLTFKERN